MTEAAPLLVVEVVACQEATIVDVAAVEGRRAAYRIGEGPRAQVTVAVPGADAEGCWTLVTLDDGRPSLHVPPEARGELQVEGDGTPTRLAAGARIALSVGTCAIVHVGPLTFTVRTAPVDPELLAARARARFRPAIEWSLWLAQAASLLLFVALALLVHLLGPRSGPPQWDDPELQAQLIGYMTGIEPRATPEDRPTGEQGSPSVRAPETPRRATPLPEVETPTAPAGPQAPAVRSGDPEDAARAASFLGLAEFDRILREYTTSLENSIHHYAPSAADDAAWAAAAKAVPRAIAGLGFADTARGGGGEAHGVIDLDWGELLKGLKARQRRGLPGQGRAESGFTKEAVPKDRGKPRQDMAWTSAVSQDLIRGVIRRHTPEVRGCFREGQATGKVEVAFTIGAGGAVQEASIASSTVDDAAVHACVTSAVKSWQFPTIVAAGGEVAVRYPFSVG